MKIYVAFQRRCEYDEFSWIILPEFFKLLQFPVIRSKYCFTFKLIILTFSIFFRTPRVAPYSIYKKAHVEFIVKKVLEYPLKNAFNGLTPPRKSANLLWFLFKKVFS